APSGRATRRRAPPSAPAGARIRPSARRATAAAPPPERTAAPGEHGAGFRGRRHLVDVGAASRRAAGRAGGPGARLNRHPSRAMPRDRRVLLLLAAVGIAAVVAAVAIVVAVTGGSSKHPAATTSTLAA